MASGGDKGGRATTDSRRTLIARAAALAVLGFTASVLIVAGAAETTPPDGDCLYSTRVGSEPAPVQPCGMSDALNIGKDPDVRKVMEAFSISPGTVVFRGCSRVPFSTTVDGAAPARYLITYPVEATDSYLAPIAHELAHVVQIRMSGGLNELRDQLNSSLRIELGADYLAGLAYSRVLRHVDEDTFQHNLALIGLYREKDDMRRHGTPAQRTGAFRYGLIDLMKADKSVERASQNFQANVYAQVKQL